MKSQPLPAPFRSFAALSILLIAIVLPIVLPQVSAAQEGNLDKSQPKGITVDEIIKRFSTKEKEFKLARDQYTFRQDVKVMTLDGDTVDGTYQQVFDVTFDDKGRKVKNVVFAPQPTLQRIMMTEEDLDDIENRILYVGQQKQDELNTYVFDVAPKQIVGKKRYFQGRIWVDDHDFQIVETYGKTVPDIHKGKRGQENLFPKFTTWREQIDGQYWFPTYTRAEDTLKFAMNDVKIREIIKYTNYRRFGSKSRVIFEGQEVEKVSPQPDQSHSDDQKPPEPQKPQ
jgi:hypothetical protein